MGHSYLPRLLSLWETLPGFPIDLSQFALSIFTIRVMGVSSKSEIYQVRKKPGKLGVFTAHRSAYISATATETLIRREGAEDSYAEHIGQIIMCMRVSAGASYANSSLREGKSIRWVLLNWV